MRIEYVGKAPPPPAPGKPAPPWWLGRRAECQKCHTIFTLTENDAPLQLNSFQIRCPMPGCGNYISIRPVYDRSGKIY